MSRIKRNKIYDDNDTLKIFIFTFEEYLKIVDCLSRIKPKDDNPDFTYILLQTKLMLIRKYETISDPVYLRNVLDAAKNLCSEKIAIFKKIDTEIDEIENNRMEIILSDGTKRSLHESIEDVAYGLYLHANKNNIEHLVKTDMTTYLFSIDKYVAFWENLLIETYDLINEMIDEKYERGSFEKATVVFTGHDSAQGKDIHSVSYWSNLRGRDAQPEEVKRMIEKISDEERNILSLAQEFIIELQKEEYSVKKLKQMIYPVCKPYWGDFSDAHKMISGIEIGFSSKVRFSDSKGIAYVLLFSHFDPNGLCIINQPHFSDDIHPLYLKKDNNRTGWKIVSINDLPDEIVRTVVIDPKSNVKKVFRKREKK